MKRYILQLVIILLAGSLAFWLYQQIRDQQHTTVQLVNSESEMTKPEPGLSPQKVVALQIEALQHNDHPYPDHGIEVAYTFASPENRQNTGPLERFTQMVRNETYESLLHFQQYGLDDIQVEGDVAVQKVTLIDANDQPAVYFFQLSRQKDGPYEDCWMTDSVIRY
ncbi:MAG: DUF4864 domain-containing protein [Cyclobacteriaceae bacterium]